LRYRALMMKKPIKLVVRRETLRALASIELARVVGGDAAVQADTGDFNCPAKNPPLVLRGG